MKILFVHDHIFKVGAGEYYSSGGLPAAVWQRYLSVFESLTVIGRDGGGLSSEDRGYTLSSREKVDFKLLPNVSNLKSLLLGNKVVTAECRKYISESDGVIVRLPSRLGQIFLAEAVSQKKPYAVEVVACPWDALWNYGGWQGKLLAPFAMINLKRRLSKSPFALYVTRSFLQGRYPAKGVTAFCSNVEIAEVSLDILRKRTDSACNKRKIIFGLIGNYSSRYKGIDVAIEALALIQKDLPEWEFQVLGSGNPDYYLRLAEKRGLADKVKFLGSRPSGQPVYDWLDTVDIYLQPSYQEGLPRALVEAMSRGLPALGTAVAGIPELLDEQELVSAGDVVMLSEKILKLTSDRDLCISQAERNFSRARQYYKPLLDERRTAFWLAFKGSIEVKL